MHSTEVFVRNRKINIHQKSYNILKHDFILSDGHFILKLMPEQSVNIY